MKKYRWLLVLAVIIILLGWGWASASRAGKQTKVTIVGSTALQPLTEAVVDQYHQQAPNVNITVQGGGSGTGLSQVQAGAVKIGASDIFSSQQPGIKADQLRDHIVAVSGIIPVVNPELKVDNLTTEQLRQVFTGEITNWREVGGQDLPITVINRASGSGTRLAFEQSIFKHGDRALTTQEQDSNGTVKEIVANIPGAISYIAQAYVNNQVKTLKLNQRTASTANIASNKWPLWSYEHLYTKDQPDEASEKFIRYMQSAPVQNKLVRAAHYVSIYDMQVRKTPTGKVVNK